MEGRFGWVSIKTCVSHGNGVSVVDYIGRRRRSARQAPSSFQVEQTGIGSRLGAYDNYTWHYMLAVLGCNLTSANEQERRYSTKDVNVVR
jgi:hypothetical protein